MLPDSSRSTVFAGLADSAVSGTLTLLEDVVVDHQSRVQAPGKEAYHFIRNTKSTDIRANGAIFRKLSLQDSKNDLKLTNR